MRLLISDANTESASSTAQDEHASPSEAQVGTAEATAATGEQTSEQIDADILKRVEENQADGSEPPPDEAGKTVDKPPAKEEPGADKTTDKDKDKQKAEDENLPFNKHPRWIARENELKAAKTENETLKATAKAWEENKAWMAERGIGEREYPEILQSYATARQSGVSHSDFSETMKWRAMVNTNPVEAIKYAENWIAQLKVHAGQMLPPELQEAVNAGHMTEEWARKTAQFQREAGGAKQTLESQKQLDTQNQQRLVEQSTAQWLESKCTNDPELQADLQASQGKFRALMADFSTAAQQEMNAKKRSLTPAEHIALLEKSYAFVNGFASKNAPRPPARKAPLRNGSSTIRELPDNPTEADLDANILATVAARQGGGF